jgi:autotransporter-associated beta strand protein
MPRTIFRTVPLLAILLAFVGPSVASAATSTWTGGSSNNSWSPQANWGTSTLPTKSGSYSLQFGGTSRTNTINDIGTISVNSISFTNTGGTGRNAFFTISSGTLAFNDSSIVTTTGTNGVFTNNSNGDTISSAMTLSGTSTFTTADLHNLSLLGSMSGSGAVIFAQATPGVTSYVYLGGTNTYTGGTVIQGGYVQTGARTPNTNSNSSAFGSGSLTISDSGTLLVRNNSLVTNGITVSGIGMAGSAVQGSFGTAGSTAELQGPITLAGNAQFTTASTAASDTTSKLLVSGPIDLGANTLTLRSGVKSGETTGLLISVTGTVSGSGGIVINGAVGGSRVLMSGNNSYTGATAVNAGTLLVNGQLGNTAVTVNASGLLGGSGTILGGVTVGSSGTLAPGNSPGVLTVGSLSLSEGSHTLMEITGTSASLYDQIVGVGSGGLTYGGNLDLVMSGSYADQTTFHLFSNFSSPSIGDFAAVGLSATGEYAGLTFSDSDHVAGVWTSTWTTNHQRLVFSTSTGDLVVVPEPSTYAMALAGLACGGWQVWRRRRQRQAPTLAA